MKYTIIIALLLSAIFSSAQEIVQPHGQGYPTPANIFHWDNAPTEMTVEQMRAIPYLAIGSIDCVDSTNHTLTFQLLSLSPFVLHVDTFYFSVNYSGKPLRVGYSESTQTSPKAFITQDHPLTLRVNLSQQAIAKYYTNSLDISAKFTYVNPANGVKRYYYFRLILAPTEVNRIKRCIENENTYENSLR